jgi:glutathionyl-hydroquinone reductase
MAFKTNRDRLVDFPNLWNYAKDLYQTPGFGDTTDFETIKRGYQLISSAERNPFRIIRREPISRYGLSGMTGRSSYHKRSIYASVSERYISG